jgi:hypothetical protein
MISPANLTRRLDRIEEKLSRNTDRVDHAAILEEARVRVLADRRTPEERRSDRLARAEALEAQLGALHGDERRLVEQDGSGSEAGRWGC